MDIATVARLAKLRLTSEEEGKLGGQLEDIMKPFESLSEIPSIETNERASGRASNLRKDVVQAYPSEQQKELLDCSAHRRENFIKLPPTL